MSSISNQSAASSTSSTSTATATSCPLPEDIAGTRAWLVWRAVRVVGRRKPQKKPYYLDGRPRRGKLGGPDDLARLASYSDAAAEAGRGRYTGVGIAMDALPGMVGLDFDRCIDADGTPTTPEARWLVEQGRERGTYIAVSPSGTGPRALVRGALPDRRGGFPPRCV